MNLSSFIRDILDYPKEGIIFKDITPLLKDAGAFKETINQLLDKVKGMDIDYVVGIDARGFIFGAALADRLGVGFIPIRKRGKLPYKSISETYVLEYGEDVIEMHEDAVSQGDKVLVVDDLLATGGTVGAACRLLKGQGADIISVAFVIELSFLNGRDVISDYPIISLIEYK